MIKSILIQLFKAAHAAVKRKLEACAERKRRDDALNTYGWDAKCPACQKWMHRNDLVIACQVTDMHWHYLCRCGHRSAWRLDGPCPMHDSSYVYKNENPLFVDVRV